MTREEARVLRAEGHTLAAIAERAGVHATTMGVWCAGVTPAPGKGSRDTQRKHRQAAEAAFEEGRWEALRRVSDPLWVAGTVMYWGEGNKTKQLGLANSDPAAIQLFSDWVLAHHDHEATFSMRLHLHRGDDECEAVSWWAARIGVPARTGKTFWKEAGTGHRANVLPHGVCTLRADRSTLMLHRTLGWIEGLSVSLSLRRRTA